MAESRPPLVSDASTEDARIVHQRIDSPEALQAFGDQPLCRRRIGDVAGSGQDVFVAGRFNGTGVGDDAVVPVAERLDQAGADPLRCSGDDGHFLLCAHDGTFDGLVARHVSRRR